MPVIPTYDAKAELDPDTRGEPHPNFDTSAERAAANLGQAVQGFSHSSEGLALYKTLGSLPQAPADLYTAVMRTGTRLLRTGVVSHPTFVLANYVKDQISVGILRNDYLPLLSGLPGLWNEMCQGEAARLYAYLGGMSAGTATSGIQEAARNDIAQLARRDYLPSHVSSIEGLMELTQITEAATRNSIFAKTYKQKLEQGLSPIDAAIEGAFQGTDILDFGQHGSRMMALRAFIPFINPHIQGLNKAATTMLVPLARLARGDILTQEDREAAANAGWALGKFAALGGTLGAVWAALNWDREEYRDAGEPGAVLAQVTQHAVRALFRAVAGSQARQPVAAFAAAEHAIDPHHDPRPVRELGGCNPRRHENGCRTQCTIRLPWRGFEREWQAAHDAGVSGFRVRSAGLERSRSPRDDAPYPWRSHGAALRHRPGSRRETSP